MPLAFVLSEVSKNAANIRALVKDDEALVMRRRATIAAATALETLGFLAEASANAAVWPGEHPSGAARKNAMELQIDDNTNLSSYVDSLFPYTLGHAPGTINSVAAYSLVELGVGLADACLGVPPIADAAA